MKKCFKCGELKSFSEFHKSSRDGYQSACKVCKNKLKVISDKIYYEKHKPRVRCIQKEYYLKNKIKIQKLQSSYVKHRLITDISFHLAKILRIRLYHAIVGQVKVGSHVKDLGCSIDFLKQHLESKFQSGMTWDNYGNGKGKWNIDHIKPLSKFDSTNPEDLKIVWHYTNLQPMWAEDNLKKRAKWE